MLIFAYAFEEMNFLKIKNYHYVQIRLQHSQGNIIH